MCSTTAGARRVPAVTATPFRLLSTPTELTAEEIEQRSILASMEKLVEQSNIVCNKGPVSFSPDLPHNLPENVAEVATLDCMPAQQKGRKVVIHAEAQHAMTSGVDKIKGWTLYWKHEERWTNPLTGWTSSADPMTSVKLTFDTKQQAIDFATKKGLDYEVKERAPRQRTFGTNYYAHNFLPAATEAKLKKEGAATKHFFNPEANKSNYFRPLKFHGDGACRQHGANQQAPIA
eukprot:CAMPEP_0172605932 /NCGR_PEP_ID=MMETSP1068-20121228/26118_1 /TAXON_ID=35684 /ORGANISM="Pseudopedinella elastica, Strain CCMP716" /LENGTH=232 /DNA_ID=CAMNT_0013408475 /DNA_START=69 /DNA_END=767 /DNA_ORIENTATION=+